MRGVLRSPHPPSECVRRLSLSIGSDSPVVGHVSGNAAVLRRRFRLRMHHPTILDLKLAANHAGSEISFVARPPVYALAFLALWFGLVSLIGGALVIGALFGDFSGDRGAVLIAVPVVLASGALIVALDRFMARHQTKYLVDFVRYMLDAE